jgi:hypothetical protein
MKQSNKLVVLALIANTSAKKLFADNIYLQFLDESLFDDDTGMPKVTGPNND